MIKPMEKEDLFMLMETYMKESGKMINAMEKECGQESMGPFA